VKSAFRQKALWQPGRWGSAVKGGQG
jgi:hypothetical protein